MIWKVIFVAGRPPRPPSKAMVGTQAPKLRPAMLDCWMAVVDFGGLVAVAAGVETVRRVVGEVPQAGSGG